MKPLLVLVQGAWGSSAAWTPVAERLRAAGHEVIAPSLTGLGERRHLYSGHVNLSTHVEDVMAAISQEAPRPLLLVAHSYGGMIATQIADRLADRLAGLVYLDAFVPRDGQSAHDLLGPEAALANMAAAAEHDGIGVPPPARHATRVPEIHRYVMRHRSPQPLATLIQRARLSDAVDRLPRHYVSATLDQAPIFRRTFAELREDPAWSTEEIAAGHMLQLEQPDAVARIVLDFSGRVGASRVSDEGAAPIHHGHINSDNVKASTRSGRSSGMKDTVVGFVGLGNMGSLMAANLLRAGLDVIAYDADASKRAAFAAEFGTREPADPRDLAGSDIILTMVPTGDIVRAVMLDGGDDSLAARLAPGSLVIDTTSSPPESTRALGADLARHGVTLIDAPVSGGRVGARAADLVFMMGGDDAEAIERAAGLLSHLGKRIFRMGPLGSGHVMKSMNNCVSAAGYVAACEALVIGRQYGLDAATMIDVLNVSTGRNFATETSMKRILAGDMTRNFALDLFTKDIRIAGGLAAARAVHAPLIGVVHDRMAQARDAVGGGGDHTTAYAFWEGQVGETGSGPINQREEN